MRRILITIYFVLLVAPWILFALVFLTPRPALSIDPATLAGDGSRLDYCRPPVLDGSGKVAAEIPKGNTPG